MKTLDVTILYHDSIPSRTYLALLSKHGFKPRKIINLQITPKYKKHRSFERLLGKRIWQSYRRSKDQLYINLNTLDTAFLNDFGLSLQYIERDPSSYALEYENVYLKGLDCPTLKKKLQKEKVKNFLFTGGGILGAELLSLKGSKFIHIHPGIVPEVKGADCFFWSCLVRGKPGYSVFYMNAGIDTGDIICSEEYEFSYSREKYGSFDNDVIYRSILNVYDPALRIMTLISFLKDKPGNLAEFPYHKQDPSAGRTYFFMHEKLRNYVIDSLKG